MAWLLGRPESAPMVPALALTLALPLPGTGAGKPGSAVRAMAVAAVPLVPTLSGTAALRATAGARLVLARAEGL
mgnify:CR=1 FL=1